MYYIKFGNDRCLFDMIIEQLVTKGYKKNNMIDFGDHDYLMFQDIGDGIIIQASTSYNDNDTGLLTVNEFIDMMCDVGKIKTTEISRDNIPKWISYLLSKGKQPAVRIHKTNDNMYDDHIIGWNYPMNRPLFAVSAWECVKNYYPVFEKKMVVLEMKECIQALIDNGYLPTGDGNWSNVSNVIYFNQLKQGGKKPSKDYFWKPWMLKEI